MKLTVVGDPHAKPDNLDRISQLFDQIEELGNPTIILGDLLDTKELVRSRCFNLIWERIRNSELTFYLLVGNHDWHNLECKAHSLEPFKALPNVVVVDEVTGLTLGKRKVAMMPYFHDLEVFRAKLKLPVVREADLVFIHQGVTGFDYGNGFIAENEVDPNELTVLKQVISGHFHKHQEAGNLIYLGTPFSHSFGESNQEKYLGVYDLDTMELELIPTPYFSHITVELDLDKEEPDFSELTALAKECFLRLILKGSQSKVNEFDRRKLGGLDIKVLERPTQEDQTEIVVSEQDSNEVKFTKWAREIKKLDEETLALGIKILKGEVA